MKVWVDHMVDDFERVQIDSKKALWEWLSLNHNSDKSYLLVTWKKTNKDRYVSREEVLDALLAYGWIDGRRYVLDENQTMQLVCKRKQQKWTQSYRQRIEQLTADGLMKASGLKSVDAAKSNGDWFANVDVDELVCPNDLYHSLQTKDAVSWWDKAAPSYKRNVLRWLASAKKEETRQKRIAQIADACGAGLKIKYL